MLSALHKHNIQPTTTPEEKVPIPEPIVLCEDSDVIGTPFYIMEFLEGRIFTDSKMLVVDPQTRHEWQVTSTSRKCAHILTPIHIAGFLLSEPSQLSRISLLLPSVSPHSHPRHPISLDRLKLWPGYPWHKLKLLMSKPGNPRGISLILTNSWRGIEPTSQTKGKRVQG